MYYIYAHVCVCREGNEWTLEAGALVLANEGIVYILLISLVYLQHIYIYFTHYIMDA